MKGHSNETLMNHILHKDTNTMSKTEERHTWNKIHLSVVCVVLPGLLMFLLNACHPSSEPSIVSLSLIWDWSAAALVLMFTVLQAALYYLPVGYVAEGKIGSHEKHLKYNINGLYAFGVCVFVSLCLWQCGVFRWTSVTSQVIPMISAGSVLSGFIGVVLFANAQTRAGCKLEAFILGVDSDPRVGNIDLKHFVMLRIGFIGWGMMDICYLLTALEKDGHVSLCLILVFIFQLIYILDLLVDEESVLSTKEFTQDSIGFLMVMGEYIWIPFFSSIPVYYLLYHPQQIDALYSIPIIILFGLSYLIYNLSNDEKSNFRKNPNDPALIHLQRILSPSGQSLLVSGWFGWVRHPNYLGDMLMMFTWALPCGFSSVLPYLPALQCTKLLKERANEIEDLCAKKHGSAWKEYCEKVPYKFVPYIY